MKIGDEQLAVNDKRWLHHVKVFKNAIEDLNEKIQKFNMIVPSSLIQKQMIPYMLDREVKKVSEQYSKFLPEGMDKEVSADYRVFDRYIASKDKIQWKETWNDIRNSFKSIRSSDAK